MRRPPFWASILTLCGAGILCTLGTWQLQRLTWKTEIIEKLSAAYAVGEVKDLDIQALGDVDFIYGRVKGRFLSDKAFLFGVRVKDEKPGADLIVPVRTKEGDVLVNLGFATGALEVQPIHHLKNKSVWFEGLARNVRWNAFTPENRPEKNIWYRLDWAQIEAAKDLKNLAPAVVYAERASHKFDAAFPNNERTYPNNNHLQYALFWFAMAGVLIVVYGFRFLRP